MRSKIMIHKHYKNGTEFMFSTMKDAKCRIWFCEEHDSCKDSAMMKFRRLLKPEDADKMENGKIIRKFRDRVLWESKMRVSREFIMVLSDIRQIYKNFDNYKKQ